MAIVRSSSQIISPCLWFDDNAEEAVKFYTSVFKNSKKGPVARYGEGGPMPAGTVLTVQFQIGRQKFLALNGGAVFRFTEAVSFIVYCKTQKEIDYYWEKLSRGGTKIECGWLKDRFGLSWQIVPEVLTKILTDKNPQKSARALQAIWKMKKLDLKAILQAYEGPAKEKAGLPGLSAPANRALEAAGIKTLQQLSRYSEAELLKLHGLGPGSIPRLRSALKTKGLSLKNK